MDWVEDPEHLLLKHSVTVLQISHPTRIRMIIWTPVESKVERTWKVSTGWLRHTNRVQPKDFQSRIFQQSFWTVLHRIWFMGTVVCLMEEVAATGYLLSQRPDFFVTDWVYFCYSTRISFCHSDQIYLNFCHSDRVFRPSTPFKHNECILISHLRFYFLVH